MRAVVLCLAVLGLVDAAAAADLDDSYIRGSDAYEPQSPTYARWEGFYAGGQVGASTAHFDFSQATQSLVAFILRTSTLENRGHVSQFPVLVNQDSVGGQFGAFVGYNSQWESVVLGLEVNYNRSAILGSQSGSLTRGVSPGDGLSYLTTVTSSANYRLSDYGVLRARAGYTVGNFLPFATLGIAVGRVNLARNATVTAIVSDPAGIQPTFTFGPQSQGEAKLAYVYGLAGSLGLDVNVWSNLFLRGEYEFMQFNVVSNMLATVQSFRVGGGVKF